jgi:hypothetical protein
MRHMACWGGHALLPAVARATAAVAAAAELARLKALRKVSVATKVLLLAQELIHACPQMAAHTCRRMHAAGALKERQRS